MGAVLRTEPIPQAHHLPFWARYLNHFHRSSLTTLQTQVSFVNRGRRVRPVSACGEQIPAFVSGLPTPGNAASGRRPLTPLVHCSNKSLNEKHLASLVGARFRSSPNAVNHRIWYQFLRVRSSRGRMRDGVHQPPAGRAPGVGHEARPGPLQRARGSLAPGLCQASQPWLRRSRARHFPWSKRPLTTPTARLPPRPPRPSLTRAAHHS